MQEFLTKLETPISTGRISDPTTLAIRLCKDTNSTHLANWTNDKLGQQTLDNTMLLDVFPHLSDTYRYIFPDTVVIRVFTPLQTHSTPSKTIVKPVDPNSINKTVQDIFGLTGDYAGCKAIDDNGGYGWQEYYLSTCNLSLTRVYGIVEGIIGGEYLYQGHPIEFVRLDVTTNVAMAVKPDTCGATRLVQDLKWTYKDNSRQVGDTCHSYIVSNNLETKIYDKLRYMLEVKTVSGTIGDNYENLLNSSQHNIKAAFHSKRFQDNGFGRVETRFWSTLPPISEIVETHNTCIKELVAAHCEPTSFKDSWESFIPPNHKHIMVIVQDHHQTWVNWTFARTVNKLTDKVNGWTGTGLEDALHTLQYRTFGTSGVEVYWVDWDGTEGKITHEGTLLPQLHHTGNLIDVKPGKVSKCAVISCGSNWGDIGLNIPLDISSRCKKPRSLNFRNTGKLDPDVNLDSLKTQQRKAKSAEAKRLKRLEADRAKVYLQVDKDKYATAPSDYRSLNHISKLANIAKPVCTRYYFEANTTYPGYMVKVGKKWYKANAQLSRLLSHKPDLPFILEVYPNGTTQDNHNIWGVKLKEY